MSATLPTLGSGVPVEVGKIDRELKKLWDQSGGVASRASLMNLAVYCEGKEAMPGNTALIGQITEDHACRAILICAEPDAPESRVQAWISAHCHMSRAGAKQVCCEQITFLLEGPSRNLIPNIVFSHLDSDLPLYLWWRGEFPDPIDNQLWTWVDRLIFDSNDWRDPCQQLKLLRDSLSGTLGRITLCDINWTRSLYFRQALSTTFDHPQNLPYLSQIEEVTLAHAPGFRSTAVLLMAWLAAQLGWNEGVEKEGGIEFTPPQGNNENRVRVSLREQPGAPLSQCVLKTADASFQWNREGFSEFLHAEIALPGGPRFQNLVPAGKQGEAALLNEELERGGPHRVYLNALAVAERFF